MKGKIYTAGELRKLCIINHLCNVPMCNQAQMKKRKTPPKTASEYSEHFDYWQCPICKTNRAYPKGK